MMDDVFALNDPMEHGKRQTGRTTRMMEAAKEACAKGKAVVVVFKDEHHAKIWREQYKDVPGLSVIPMRVTMPELDWKQLKFVKGPYANHETFLDHDVIFVYHKELFRAWAQYDQKPEVKQAA
jgi:hypothetical protein